jgi:hypothetical protein
MEELERSGVMWVFVSDGDGEEEKISNWLEHNWKINWRVSIWREASKPADRHCPRGISESIEVSSSLSKFRTLFKIVLRVVRVCDHQEGAAEGEEEAGKVISFRNLKKRSEWELTCADSEWTSTISANIVVRSEGHDESNGWILFVHCDESRQASAPQSKNESERSDQAIVTVSPHQVTRRFLWRRNQRESLLEKKIQLEYSWDRGWEKWSNSLSMQKEIYSLSLCHEKRKKKNQRVFRKLLPLSQQRFPNTWEVDGSEYCRGRDRQRQRRRSTDENVLPNGDSVKQGVELLAGMCSIQIQHCHRRERHEGWLLFAPLVERDVPQKFIQKLLQDFRRK